MALISLRLRVFAPLREMFYESPEFFTTSRANGILLQAPELFVDEVLRVVWLLPDGLAD
jgi:hypothetical protein